MSGPTRPSRPDRLTTVVGVLATGLLSLLLLVRLALRPELDVDTWLHLRIGRHLLEGGGFGLPDPWVTLADHAYVPNQGLSQVLGAWVEGHAGLRGVQAMYAVCLLAFAALLIAGSRLVAPPLVVALVVPFGLLVAMTNLSQRPQTAGFVLLAAIVLLWWKTLQDSRLRWSISALTWALAWVHGTWTIAVGMGLAFSVALLLDQPSARTQWRRLALLNSVGALATMLTPLGPSLWLTPLTVAGSASAFADEWQPPGLASPFALVLLAMVLACAAALFTSARRHGQNRYGRWLLLAAATAMGMSMTRMLAPAALMVVPLLAESLTAALPLGRRPPVPSAREFVLWAVTGSISAITMGLGVARFDASAIPVSYGIDRQLASLAPNTVMYGDPHLTGWLIHDHPHVTQLVDLRYELFDRSTIRESRDALDGGKAGQDWLSQQAAVAVLVDKHTGLARSLATAPTWQRVTEDANYVLYERG